MLGLVGTWSVLGQFHPILGWLGEIYEWGLGVIGESQKEKTKRYDDLRVGGVEVHHPKMFLPGEVGGLVTPPKKGDVRSRIQTP